MLHLSCNKVRKMLMVSLGSKHTHTQKKDVTPQVFIGASELLLAEAGSERRFSKGRSVAERLAFTEAFVGNVPSQL